MLLECEGNWMRVGESCINFARLTSRCVMGIGDSTNAGGTSLMGLHSFVNRSRVCADWSLRALLRRSSSQHSRCSVLTSCGDSPFWLLTAWRSLAAHACASRAWSLSIVVALSNARIWSS